MELVVKAIPPLNIHSGSSVCPATVWIIFTRILNVISASQYNCLVSYLAWFSYLKQYF